MARDDAKSSSLRRRPSRTVPATIVAALLAAAGVAGVWATVQRLASGTWPGWVSETHRWGTTRTWGSLTVIVIGVVLALLGLLLLVTALRPGMANAYEVHPDADEDALSGRSRAGSQSTEFVMTRRAIAKLATAHAALVDGVDSVSAAVSSRRVNVSVKTASTQADEISRLVTAKVSEALVALSLSPQPTVTTTVRTTQP